ncbi:hypothetical protein RINTHH_15210 [Richelia intracellularis HH01]|uniref:Uncharacterized protein n=1 Tax=Richelia intracellularis HH01 TaxID=1165094 RepID=M1X5X4_9NOST|nr:hypothetical protein RINTHH_15210 [Richelia intracellularis HH01]
MPTTVQERLIQLHLNLEKSKNKYGVKDNKYQIIQLKLIPQY